MPHESDWANVLDPNGVVIKATATTAVMNAAMRMWDGLNLPSSCISSTLCQPLGRRSEPALQLRGARPYPFWVRMVENFIDVLLLVLWSNKSDFSSKG